MPLLQIGYRLFRPYTAGLITLVAFGVLGALLDGIGINMLVPFLSFLTGGSVGSLDTITRVARSAFLFFGVPFQFRTILIFMVLLFTARAGVMVVFSFVRARIGVQFLERESGALLSETLGARWPYLLSLPGGYIMNTIFWDVKRASQLLDSLAQAVQSWSGCLVYLVVAFLISPLITTTTVVAGAVFLLVFRPFLRKTRVFAEMTARAEKLYSQHLMEHLGGLKNVKVTDAEDAVNRVGVSYLARLSHAVQRSALVQSLSTSLVQPFSLIFILGLFSMTYTTGSFNLAGFAATIYLIQKIFTYLQSGQASFHALNELAPYAANVVAFRDSLKEEQEPKADESLETFSFDDGLSFEHVSFSYKGADSTLSDISFMLHPGETLAIIGPSGAGKTTVADLVLRLFEPTGGRILLDGVVADRISMHDWRHNIGYVSQDVFLLNASISENIRFYHPELSEEEVQEAARRAHIYDFIMTLPHGFDTLTGDRGVLLSGGQRQRIALARALARNPRILILDEATSALDRDSERFVQESIDALHGTVAVLVIAHRLSTIERADTILVLEDGHVREIGTPAELLADPASYYARHRAAG